jgi:light-regulated signal transduction histidine kinase (bacteriophytochrome)
MRALASEDRDAPATHIALAGALAAGDALRAEADAHWAAAAEDEACRRWQRDRELLKVASSARTRRTERAWERIAQGSEPIAQHRQSETPRVQRAELERAKDVLARQAERLRILHEIDRKLIAQESTEAIAAAVLPSLRELLGVPRVIVNLFDLATGEVEWLAAAGRRKTRVGGVRYSIRLMGDLEALRRGETQVLRTRELPAGTERDALLASGVDIYMVVPMIAAGELIGGLSFGGAEPTFPEEQVEIARQAAAQLAIAISQVRLFERVKRHADELEERVRERTAELQSANQALEGFSYSVSHDLRAPLRAVSGYAQILEEDYGARLDDEGRRLLRVVSGSAERMGQLIDGLLTFSRLGRQPVHAVQVEMRPLVREVVDELAPEHPAAHIDVGELPEATGDRMLLRQVWANLIGNALKYSSKNESPRVEIGGRADNGEIVYWVADNGAGFDMRYVEKLFRVFQRLHSEHEFSGTGVGLAIVERVVARHGGRVWAEGEPNRGAKFFFTLPRNVAPQG